MHPRTTSERRFSLEIAVMSHFRQNMSTQCVLCESELRITNVIYVTVLFLLCPRFGSNSVVIEETYAILIYRINPKTCDLLTWMLPQGLHVGKHSMRKVIFVLRQCQPDATKCFSL